MYFSKFEKPHNFSVPRTFFADTVYIKNVDQKNLSKHIFCRKQQGDDVNLIENPLKNI